LNESYTLFLSLEQQKVYEEYIEKLKSYNILYNFEYRKFEKYLKPNIISENFYTYGIDFDTTCILYLVLGEQSKILKYLYFVTENELIKIIDFLLERDYEKKYKINDYKVLTKAFTRNEIVEQYMHKKIKFDNPKLLFPIYYSNEKISLLVNYTNGFIKRI
jgi:hypothetical protein